MRAVLGVYVCVRGSDPPPRRPRPATPTERVARVYTIRWLGAADARAAVAGAPSRCDNRRANTFHQLFFLYWKLMRQRAPRHFNSNRNSHNISKPNKTSSWILDDSEAGNVTIRGCDEIVKSINTVITSKKY